MRHLFQPRVLGVAVAAALGSALMCYPRLLLWHRPAPLWYLEAVIFCCTALMWGFVFAWHTVYTGQPVFLFKQERASVVAATLTAIGLAAVYHFGLDPLLQAKVPEDYPPDVEHWLASVGFILGLNQLVLVFAPFDWLMRLLKNRYAAVIVTALFGAGVAAYKVHSLAIELSPGLLAAMLSLRMIAATLAVIFYLRGGLFLVWWWTFLMESRHVLDFGMAR